MRNELTACDRQEGSAVSCIWHHSAKFMQQCFLMESKKNVRAMLVDRGISKGQVKHLLTRNTSNRMELDKMTRYIEKQRSQKESQFQHSQQLLMSRYCGFTYGYPNPERRSGQSEGRFHFRDFEPRQRSRSFDPSKLSRCDDDSDSCRVMTTKRLQAVSHRASDWRGLTSRDPTDQKSKGGLGMRPRAMTDLPRLVLPPVYAEEQRSTGKDGLSARAQAKHGAAKTHGHR